MLPKWETEFFWLHIWKKISASIFLFSYIYINLFCVLIWILQSNFLFFLIILFTILIWKICKQLPSCGLFQMYVCIFIMLCILNLLILRITVCVWIPFMESTFCFRIVLYFVCTVNIFWFYDDLFPFLYATWLP